MSGTKQGLEPADVINIIDRLKTLFRSPEEQDFLNELKYTLVYDSDRFHNSETNRFSVKQFTDKIQRESEILHELARTIHWGEQQSKTDDWRFHE